MSFPSFTADDLSVYSGRPSAGYPAYSTSALTQSMLLFRLATCLTTWPTDSVQAELAKNAVLSLADALVLGQPFQGVLASPFVSEGIGSYNYSLRSAATLIRQGLPLGVSWFDIAISHLGVCTDGGIYGGGISFDSIGVFENDADFYVDADMKKHVIAPHDVDPFDFPPFWNTQSRGTHD